MEYTTASTSESKLKEKALGLPSLLAL